MCPLLEGNTKKKIIIADAASSSVAAPAIAADTDQKDFDINARVTQECSLENPSNVNLGSLQIDRAPGPNALLLTATASDSQNIWMSCNYPADISLQADNRALVNSNPVTDTAQFTNRLNYRVGLQPSNGTAFDGFGSWAPFVQPQPTTRTQTAEFHDQASLTVTLPHFEYGNQNRRPIAGDYTDTVTITLGTI